MGAQGDWRGSQAGGLFPVHRAHLWAGDLAPRLSWGVGQRGAALLWSGGRWSPEPPSTGQEPAAEVESSVY